MNSAVRVAVLFGGPSTEHEVSCSSAAGVVQHLDRARYEVVPVRITRAGRWLVGADRPGPVDVAALRAMTPEDGPAPQDPVESIFAALAALRDVDVVLPCLHGVYGEDGTVQNLLELAGIAYAGSGVLASATAMDKEFTKKIVAAEGIAVADAVVLTSPDDTVAEADRERLGLPVFVKPARGGSSLGVTRVDDWADLPKALAEAWSGDTKVLVEAAVPGREVDIAVLQQPDGSLATGPALEIKIGAGSGFFDYAAKYAEAATEFVIPADLPRDLADLLADTAVRTFRALGCAGLLRVDFFLPEVDGRIVPTLNEVNTMPGFTPMSQFPRIWATAGLSYPELLDRLVATALARAGRPAGVPAA